MSLSTLPALATWLALAAAPAVVQVQPGTAHPGDAVLLSVEGAAGEPEGEFAGNPLSFVPFQGRHLALVGLRIEQPAGELKFQVRFVASGAERRVDGTVAVLDPDFPARELKVSKRFTSPDRKARKRMKEDQKAFDQAFSQELAPPFFLDDFTWPRDAVRTAPYGDRRLFNGRQKSQHYGIDLDGAVGEPVGAANDGEVVMARDCFASGNTVVLHHGLGLYSAYFHLSKIAVAQGALVKQGQKLGLVGKTGRVTGPHLHFGTKLEGRWVNPESVLRLRFGGVAAPTGPSTPAGASPGRP